MMLKVALLSLVSLSMTLILTSIPLSTGITIFLMALISIFSLSIVATTWLALGLFLIYIGGMLVLFSYFLAILPNQFLNMSLPTTFSLLVLSIIGLNEHQLLFAPQWGATPFSTHLILANQNMPIVVMLATTLLLILIIAVKLTTITAGPLRPFNP